MQHARERHRAEHGHLEEDDTLPAVEPNVATNAIPDARTLRLAKRNARTAQQLCCTAHVIDLAQQYLSSSAYDSLQTFLTVCDDDCVLRLAPLVSG